MPRTSLTSAERQLAWELRQAGFTYDAIAARVGYANGGAARHAVLAHAATLNGTSYTRGRTALPVAALPDWTIPTWFAFGVELEVASIDRPTMVAAIQGVTGRQVLAGAGYHNGQAHGWADWSVEHDGSISPSGYEAVSPIMHGEAGLAEVAAVADAIRAAGGRVNTTTGMHVHVSLAELTDEQGEAFIDWYTLGQGAINRLVAPNRVGRHTYTAPLTSTDVQIAKARLRRTNNYGGYQRYRHLNSAHLSTRRCIEVRQHHGTVRGSQVRTWVRLLAGATVAAKNGTLRPARTRSLDTLLTGISLPEATVTALRGRVARQPQPVA